MPSQIPLKALWPLTAMLLVTHACAPSSPEATPTVTPAPFVPTATFTLPGLTSTPLPGQWPTATVGEAVDVPPTEPPPVPTEPPAAVDTQPPLPPSGGAHPAEVRLEMEQVADKLFQPTGVVFAGDVPGRFYVLEKRGRVRIVQDGDLRQGSFLDLQDRVASDASENGLLGLAFHPNYLTNGLFYVYYNNQSNQTILAHYRVSDDPDEADPSSESVLLTIDQPTQEHNGGQLAFGPDGHLYLGVGDGGVEGDPDRNAQNGGNLLGNIIRIDVNGGSPYGIPPDNPFANDGGFRDEIWAYGLRNPWRFSFDRATGDLYIADVGDLSFEEVNVQPAGVGGQNYGWPDVEGRHCYPGGQPCEEPGAVPPVFEYTREDGCAIIGGYVYRGLQYPILTGMYLFGDFCSGTIWGLRRTPEGEWQAAKMLQTDYIIGAFAEDPAGEVYVVDHSRGNVYHVTAFPR